MDSSTGKTDPFATKSHRATKNDCPNCELQKNLNVIRQIDFFAVLPIELLKVIAYLCSREIYRAGEVIFEQGNDDGLAIYVITGQVQMIREIEEKKELIRTFEQGTFLGGLSLLGRMPRHFSLKAVVDSVGLIISREQFVKVVDQHPQHVKSIIQTIVRAVNEWEKQMLVKRINDCGACQSHLGVSLL